MYSDKDYPTASQIIQLGNIVNWFRNRNLQVYGLTSSQSEAIHFILRHEDEDITAGRLMDELKLSQSTIAGILRRLEDKGLIERSFKNGDARTSIIRTTKQGTQLRAQIKQSAIHDEYELLAELSEEERAAFKATLQTVLNHMKQVKDKYKTMG